MTEIKPKCGDCGRDRTPEDDDYSPIQPILGQPFGWYSGSDGELCPECFTALMRLGNSGRKGQGA